MNDQDREFVEFARTRGRGLRRSAYLLCGDWHRAEDLVQSTLIKLFEAWPRVCADGGVDGYVRQILVRTAIDESRRHWWREQPAERLPDLPTLEQGSDSAMDVRRALAALPPRQRAVVVLRYWEDLPVEEVARLLGCRPGTVKSQAFKALAVLRQALDQNAVLEGLP